MLLIRSQSAFPILPQGKHNRVRCVRKGDIVVRGGGLAALFTDEVKEAKRERIEELIERQSKASLVPGTANVSGNTVSFTEEIRGPIFDVPGVTRIVFFATLEFIEGKISAEGGRFDFSDRETATFFAFVGGQTLMVALNEQNDSGQSGQAILSAVGEQTVVALSLSPGAVESQLVHIHSGGCGNDTLGAVEYGLTNITEGLSVTTVDVPLANLRTGDFAINSHKEDEAAVYTACGNIPTEADALTIDLEQQNNSGQSGRATLTARGGQTEVVLSVPPGRTQSELAHIHSGECGNDTLGDVVHSLMNIGPPGSSVPTVDVSLSDLRTGDFAINSHKIGEPGVLQGSQPDLTIKPLTEGELTVSGEPGIYGGFTTDDASGTTIGGGLIGTWLSSGPGTAYGLTLTGDDATVVQLRFNRLLDNFICGSS